MRGRAVAVGLLAVYAVALAFVLLVPDAGFPSSLLDRTADGARWLGAPEWLLVANRWEFFANVTIVVPAAALSSCAWPQRDWTFWTSYGFVGALAVEAVQGVLLASRDATYVDVVANTSGALTGAIIVSLLRRVPARS